MIHTGASASVRASRPAAKLRGEVAKTHADYRCTFRGARGAVASVNVSFPGGVPKGPIARTTIGRLGLAGDGQRTRPPTHGGTEKAVCLFSLEQIARVNADGHDLYPGAIGENITTRGIDLLGLPKGTRLHLGRDAIVEVTETGSSLRANNLRIVCDLLTSTTRFVANPRAALDPWKRQKMYDLILMLKGAMAAEGKVGLMMNVRKADLARVLAQLPALKNPTVAPLADPEFVAVNTIIDEDTVRHIIPQLKAAGASGIVEYPLTKIID